MSIPRKNTPRKGKDAGKRPYPPESGAAPQAAPLEYSGETSFSRRDIPSRLEDGGAAAAAGMTSPALRAGRVGGMAGFTAEELEELARADKEIDDAPDILTPEERAMSRALDRATKEARLEKRRARDAAARARETPEQRAARLAKKKAWREAYREQLRARNAAYNAAHRQERRDYQKAYDAAHREEIRAKGRARYAARKAAVKRKDGNDGRKV